MVQQDVTATVRSVHATHIASLTYIICMESVRVCRDT